MFFNMQVTSHCSFRPSRASFGCVVKSICLKRGLRVQRHWPTLWSLMWSCRGSQVPPTTWWQCLLTTSNTPALCPPSLTSRGWVFGLLQDLFMWHYFGEVKGGGANDIVAFQPTQLSFSHLPPTLSKKQMYLRPSVHIWECWSSQQQYVTLTEICGFEKAKLNDAC